MSPSRISIAAVPLAMLALALSACSAPAARVGAPGSSSSPTSGSRTATTPAPKPTPTPAKPKPKPTVTQVAQTRPRGTGPGGSILRTGSSAVALTFDDGPDPVYTPKMLDLLKKYRVRATFCLIGTSAKAYPALVRRIVAEGHTLCNHSWRHRTDLAKQTDAVILKDLQDTSDAIRAAVPGAKIRYFRAPGGNFTTHLVSLAASLGMKSIYWTVDPRDWDFATYGRGTSMVDHIIVAVESHVRPGAIILSHDSHKPDTVTAYRTLLPWLKARYKLIALPT